MNVLTPTCALRTSVTYTVKGSISGIKGDENDETLVSLCFYLTQLLLCCSPTETPPDLFRTAFSLNVWETRSSSPSRTQCCVELELCARAPCVECWAGALHPERSVVLSWSSVHERRVLSVELELFVQNAVLCWAGALRPERSVVLSWSSVHERRVLSVELELCARAPCVECWAGALCTSAVCWVLSWSSVHERLTRLAVLWIWPDPRSLCVWLRENSSYLLNSD